MISGDAYRATRFGALHIVTSASFKMRELSALQARPSPSDSQRLVAH
jgi:hypothetical protein